MVFIGEFTPMERLAGLGGSGTTHGQESAETVPYTDVQS